MKWIRWGFLCLVCVCFSAPAYAQSIGKWEMNEGGGLKKFSKCSSKHGDIPNYKLASIPPYPGPGWKTPPNPKIIGLARKSTLCGQISCRCGADFTYFRNTITFPANFKLTKFEIELRGMDDGTRITIYNSAHPKGITPQGAYVFLGGTLTQDLKAYAKVGEVNTVILTHMDDCCSESNLREAYIRVNGKRVTQCIPAQEICDGVDNDCDGKIDEGLKRSCKGACGAGEIVCVGGKWSSCSADKAGTEICDGKDNDCDGLVDENLSRPCKNQCGSGVQHCVAGDWTPCSAPQPRTEVCDGKDNDCDGKADNKAICPTNSLCVNGQCMPRCKDECPKGMQCVNGTCTGNPCKDVQCAKDELCITGKCRKLCDLLQCPAGQVCSGGTCVADDCYFKGCPQGQRCNKGRCETNPCASVTCKGNTFCRDGKCISSCAGVSCSSTELCKDGTCIPDTSKTGACAGKQCQNHELCIDGKCQPDNCATLPCPKGRVCRNGQCIQEPCANIQCPGSQTCKNGQCTGDKAIPTPDGDVGQDGQPPQDAGTSPDRGSNDPTPQPDNSGNGTDKSVGSKAGDGDNGGRRGSTGCLCHVEKDTPSVPLSLLLLIGFFWRRRKR